MSACEISPPQTIHALYRDHHGWLHGWLRNRLGCTEQAADLAHDTYSAIEVSFDATQRAVRLIAGEIFVKVAHDENRPVLVQNRHGSARSFEGEFALRQFELRSRLAVFSGTIDLLPQSAQGTRNASQPAGRQCWFGADAITTMESATPISR